MAIKLQVFSKPQYKCYDIEFANEAQALAYYREHSSGDAVPYVTGESPDGMISADEAPTLYALLYPTCEHGMSADLCYGPGHYPPDNYF